MTYSDDHSYPGNDVPQKPMTEAMLSTPHGTYNYEEYRHVLTVAGGSTESLHFWATYGVFRILHRTSSWWSAALRHGSQNLPADEYEHGLDYLRAVYPIIREFEGSKGSMETFVLSVSDYPAIESLLSLSSHPDSALLYWAKRGVVFGLESLRFMSNLISDGKMQPLELEFPCPDLAEFMKRSELLLKQYESVNSVQ
ncbi:hypothetical protein V0M98_32030 (plasmid) [Pseudomonas silesiensis]|uniref:hypothetical protein n=1 Tax=Pseudomonas silesiensis TaxID=1853130 RepID=UPI0030D48300